MTYRTHVATTTAVALPVLIIGHILNVFILVGVIIGSMLPDIDKKGSHISKFVPILPGILEKKYGHRGAVHSLAATGIIGLITIILAFLSVLGIINTYIPAIVLFGITIGFFLHLCEDGLSVSGIKWFAPFKNKSYKISDKSIFKFLKYKTIGFSSGFSKENVYLIIAVILIILEIYIFRSQISFELKRLIVHGHSGLRFPHYYHHNYMI